MKEENKKRKLLIIYQKKMEAEIEHMKQRDETEKQRQEADAHTVIRLPQERFGSHMIFIFAVTSLLFSIIMSGTASAVDAVANSNVAQMRALVDSDDEDEQRQ